VLSQRSQRRFRVETAQAVVNGRDGLAAEAAHAAIDADAEFGAEHIQATVDRGYRLTAEAPQTAANPEEVHASLVGSRLEARHSAPFH
jgi:hypothetical protein